MAGLVTTVDALEATEWGDYVNPTGFLTDDPSFGFPIGPISLVGDRDDGQERRLIETETQLAAIRGQARVLSWSTPYAANVLANLSNYVIGGGFSYTAQAARKVKPEAIPEGLLDAVQDEIDSFLDLNDWCGSQGREGEILRRTVRDGESFPALFVDEAGEIRSRLIDPEQVTEPGSTRSEEDRLWRMGLLTYDGPLCWSFGILTPDGDVERTLGYWVQWTQSAADADFLPWTHVEHLKVNSDSNVKRGWSDFFCLLQDFQREATLRKNTAIGAALQAAIVWVQEMAAGTTSGQAANMVSANATGSRTQTGPSSSRTVQQTKYNAGTTLKLGPGMKYVQGPMGSDRIPNFMLIAGYVLKSIGARWQMPEYMISSDASNANYASTMVSESPFIRARESDQRFYGSRFHNVMWKALRIGWSLGRFSRFGLGSFRELERLIDVQVEPPAITTRNKSEETTRNQALHTAGLLSKRTWAQREDLDVDAEQKNLGEERPGSGAGTSPVIVPGDSVEPGKPDEPAAGDGDGEPDKSLSSLALNGAQIASLVDLINQLTTGKLPMASARSIISAAFPMLDTTEVNGILKPLINFKPSTGHDSTESLAKPIADAVRDQLFKTPFFTYP